MSALGRYQADLDEAWDKGFAIGISGQEDITMYRLCGRNWCAVFTAGHADGLRRYHKTIERITAHIERASSNTFVPKTM